MMFIIVQSVMTEVIFTNASTSLFAAQLQSKTHFHSTTTTTAAARSIIFYCKRQVTIATVHFLFLLR